MDIGRAIDGYALLAAAWSPFWLPVVFGLYAVIRRQFTLRLLFAFISCECIGLAMATRIFQNITH